MRSLIAACCTCGLAVVWATHQPSYVYSAIQPGTGAIGGVSGLLLFFSSIDWCRKDRRLAIIGFASSLPAICLPLLGGVVE
jgi:hypothetical protein